MSEIKVFFFCNSNHKDGGKKKKAIFLPSDVYFYGKNLIKIIIKKHLCSYGENMMNEKTWKKNVIFM